MPPTQIGFKWMKPIRGGNQMATMEIPKHPSLHILKKGRLRIGVVYFRTRLEPPKAIRCFRCYGYGHWAADCARPDRRDQKTCMTCGGQGHQAKSCDSPPHCVLCEEIGRSDIDHYPGSGRCEAYRRATAEEANKQKKAKIK